MKEQQIKKGYTGYLLTDHARSLLLGQIEPVFPNVVAHHVTHQFGVFGYQKPPEALSVRVTAVATDSRVQAAVVKVNGTTARPDGGTYHITISHAAGAAPVDSNYALDDLTNWQYVDQPFDLAVIPKFFSF